MSILLNTNQRSLLASSELNLANSSMMAFAAIVGSLPSIGAISIRCNKMLVRDKCLKNLMPSPAPLLAPGTRPGISAITKLRCSSIRTTPKFGCRVVNG